MVLHFPIGVKIFALALFILLLLMAVAVGNYRQMNKVNNEIIDIATHITPIKSHIEKVNILARKQRVHFERLLRLYHTFPRTHPKVMAELTALKQLSAHVDREILQVITRADVAVKNSRVFADVIEFARLIPVLEILEEDHQNFEDHTVAIVTQATRRTDTQQALTLLAAQEKKFNRRIHDLLLTLSQFTQRTAQQTDIHAQNLRFFNTLLAIIATLGGLLLATRITLRIVRPIHALTTGAKAFGQGDLAVRVDSNSNDEIGQLSDSFNHMVAQVHQKDRLMEIFGRYIDPRIVEILLKQDPTSANSCKQQVTVFFSDLAQFSTISELLTPERLINFINHYLTLATEPITDSHGVIDKFIGDAIVAFWHPPFVGEQHAKLACDAALAQHAQLQKLQSMLTDIIGIRKGLPQLNVRIGLDTGELVVGNVGAKQTKSFTVIGKAVEIAEQLEGANKRYGTHILMTARTRQLAGDEIQTRKIDYLPIGAQGKSMAVYELMGYVGAVDPAIVSLCQRFEQGLEASRNGAQAQAEQHFNACLAIRPNDPPSRYYLAHLLPTSEH